MLRAARIASLVAAGLVALAAPARAETATLQCTLVTTAMAGQRFTVDFDFAAGVARYSNQVYSIDEVNERYIYYGANIHDPYTSGSPWRLDRKTGVSEVKRAGTNEWSAQATCQRVEGKVL